MSLLSFIKKLIMFDVIWGKRSAIIHGIRDGGAKASEIADPDQAIEFNGNTIFNINHPNNELFGGHYHSTPYIPTQDTFRIEMSRSNNITTPVWLLNEAIPSNVVGPSIPYSTGRIKKIFTDNANLATYDVEVYEHDGISNTLLDIFHVINKISETKDVDIPITFNKQIAIKVIPIFNCFSVRVGIMVTKGIS